MFRNPISKDSKTAIIKILSLYLGTTFIFLTFFFTMGYFQHKKELLFPRVQHVNSTHFIVKRHLIKQTHNIIKSHKKTNSSLPDILQEIRKINIKQILYDEIKNEKIAIFTQGLELDNLLFSNLDLELNQEILEEIKNNGMYKNRSTLIVEPSLVNDKMYSLNKAHNIDERKKNLSFFILINEQNYDPNELAWLKAKMTMFWILSLLLAGVIAYFLVRMFLTPLNKHIQSLDFFIKDSTHEINTPLSIILMSTEMLEKERMYKSQKEKINRIKIASMRLSNLYLDLVAYNFPNTLSNKITKINLKKLLIERTEYLRPFLDQKDIILSLDMEISYINANQIKITRLIDNLINNAIKYNKKRGTISIFLRPNILKIKDSGCGIESQNLSKIFDRYARFEKSKGGFGLGLSLVKNIADTYNINIKCHSIHKKETEFILTW